MIVGGEFLWEVGELTEKIIDGELLRSMKQTDGEDISIKYPAFKVI